MLGCGVDATQLVLGIGAVEREIKVQAAVEEFPFGTYLKRAAHLRLQGTERSRIIRLGNPARGDMGVPNGEPASPEIVLEILKELPVTEGAEPYLEVKVLLDEPEPMLRQEVEEALADKNYRLARIVSTYRNETGNAEKENENWKRGLQEMSPLQIAQSAFEKIYQVEMPEELTDLFQEAYLAATRKEEEEE